MGAAVTGWEIAARPPWMTPRSYPSMLAHSDGSIYISNGYGANEPYQADVWRSDDWGHTWLKVNETPGWERIYSSYLFEMPDGGILKAFGAWTSDTWKSTDKGVTWTNLVPNEWWYDGFEPSMVMLSDGNLVISGEDDPATSHILKSTDNGLTWTTLCADAGWIPRSEHKFTLQSGNCIVCSGGQRDPWTSGYLNDVWRSSDGGTSWACMTSSAQWASRIYHTVSALSDNTLILIGGESKAGTFFGEVWKSIDNGANWTLVTNTPPFGTIARHACVVISGDVLMIMGGDTPTDWDVTDSIWTSVDKGVNWTQIPSINGLKERICFGMVAAPNGTVLLTGGYRIDMGASPDVWVTTDGGYTWTETTAAAPWGGASYPTIVSLPDNSFVFCGGYHNGGGGVWRTTDNGINWTCMTSSPEYQVRGSIYEDMWTSLPDGSIVLAGGYVSYAVGAKNDVWRSTDKGAHWTCRTSNAQFRKITSHRMVSLSDNSILLLGGFYWAAPTGPSKDVWKSTDLGANWTSLTSSIDFNAMGMERVVVLPDDTLVMATWNSGKVYESTNEGVTWTEIESFNGSNAGGFGMAYISGDGILIQGGYDYSDSVNGFVYKLADDAGISGNAPITRAVPGDIYNIGGISGDPTTHIEFTMWKNSMYGE